MSNWKAPPRWRKLREAVFRRDGHVCWRCGRYAGTVDHVIPVALGGTHALSNLRPACQPCNSSTGASMGNRMYPRTPPWRRDAWARAAVRRW
jgi:5-methylcytosine-specific restriction endonuclease McrA